MFNFLKKLFGTHEVQKTEAVTAAPPVQEALHVQGVVVTVTETAEPTTAVKAEVKAEAKPKAPRAPRAPKTASPAAVKKPAAKKAKPKTP